MIYSLPTGWQWVPLGSIAQIVRGVSFDRYDASDSEAASYVPILRAGNIHRELVIDHDIIWVPPEKVSDLQLLQVGDIAICMSSGSADVVGKTAQLKSSWRGSVGAFCAIIRPNSPIASADYLSHTLDSPYFTAWRNRLCMGANIQNLRISDLESVRLPIPPLSEQRRIVEILNEARDIRRLRQEADDLTGQLIPAIFDEMFGDPISAAPAQSRTPVSEFVSEMQGGKSLGENPSGSRFRVVKVSAVTWGRFQPNESKYVDDSYDPPVSHAVRRGDLLFSRANTPELVGATVLVTQDYPDILLSDKIWRFVWRVPEEVNLHYMLALFQHPSVRRELSSRATGTGGSMKNISKAKLMSLRVSLAELSDQNRFGQIVENIPSPRLGGEFERQLLRSLLAHAFSGELTSAWRGYNQELLVQEAAERDQWLAAAGVTTATRIHKPEAVDKTPDGREIDLNCEQRLLLTQVRSIDRGDNDGIFTLSTLVSELEEPLDRLPVDAIRRHLDVLAARGLVMAVSRRAGDNTGSDYAFGNLYRLPRRDEDITSTGEEPDYQRMSELARLANQGRVVSASASNKRRLGQTIDTSDWGDHTQAPDTEE